MTLAELRKGAQDQPGNGGGGAGDRPDADFTAGEAKGSAPVHDGAHRGGDGRAPDDDCDLPGSGAGCADSLSTQRKGSGPLETSLIMGLAIPHLKIEMWGAQFCGEFAC